MKRIILISAVLIFFLGCAKQEKTEARNMEQIYLEEGVPVVVQTMLPTTFSKELKFNANLSGIRQSAASAMIGGRIEKVHVRVGDFVQKDQVLFEFPEDAPAGQLTQARSAFELAAATLARMQNLFEKGGISRQDLDGIQTQYNVAKANLDAALQMLKVRAPIAGHITNITVRETDGVQAETVLAIVSQTDKMKARIWATEDEICLIEPGQTATATWNDIILKGKVMQTANSMDLSHNAFSVDLEFDNKENLCKSGVIAEIAIETYKNDSAFVLARTSIKEDSQGKFIYKANYNQAHKIYIETGQENGFFEIINGIANGDQVIVESLNLISDGAKVKIVRK